MKVFLFRQKFNLLGITANVYRVCTHSSKCAENREFTKFEKRNGVWLVWVNDSVNRFETLDEVLNFVRNEVCKQVEFATQEKLTPNEIEIVGLNKIVED